jgi:homogentisate 1,2-dioxygenase
MADELKYQSGGGNEFATESLSGALPVGRRSPRHQIAEGKMPLQHPSKGEGFG